MSFLNTQTIHHRIGSWIHRMLLAQIIWMKIPLIWTQHWKGNHMLNSWVHFDFLVDKWHVACDLTRRFTVLHLFYGWTSLSAMPNVLIGTRDVHVYPLLTPSGGELHENEPAVCHWDSKAMQKGKMKLRSKMRMTILKMYWYKYCWSHVKDIKIHLSLSLA